MSGVDFIPAAPIDIEAQSADQPTVSLGGDRGIIAIDFSSPAISSIEVQSSQQQPELTVEDSLPTTIDILASAAIRFEVRLPSFPAASSNNYVLLAVESINQTQLTLPTSSKIPHKSELFVNGTKAAYGRDYTIDGVVLTWLESLILEPSDEIEIIYE